MAPSGKKRASSPSGRPQPESKLSQPRSSSKAVQSDSEAEGEMGEFEDKWEDEYESEEFEEAPDQDEEDEEVGHARDQVGQMDLDENQQQPQEPVPYLPQLGQGNKELAQGEELVPDWSSYVMLHHARLAWPCLSFDVLRDVSSSLKI